MPVPLKRPSLMVGLVVSLLSLCIGCGEAPFGVGLAQPAETAVKMDFLHRPMPEIPLPNDVATRFDADSPTGRRLNASMVAPTFFEQRIRELLDELDGWGVFQPISIPFDGPLDVGSILAGHRDPDYATANDVIYLLDVDPDSPAYGALHHLDLGEGNYPVVLEDLDLYGDHDPRGWTLTLLFEEADEDTNGNGVLDPGEDTDADGVLDRPNYLPGHAPAREDLAGRADALMTFYERETHTVIARPLVPLREQTTYAVLVTRRLLDADGAPVGSPYRGIHHGSQTEALRALPELLAGNHDAMGGLGLSDVAFAFTFTTQSVTSDFVAVRDGLYGHGVQGHLAGEYPARFDAIYPLLDEPQHPDLRNRHILHSEFVASVLGTLGPALGADLGQDGAQVLVDSHRYIDFHVVGSFTSPQLFERYDADGALLPYNDQSWPHDLSHTPVQARPEQAFFWLAVPRPENSARGRGEPAPLVVYAHGYTSNHLDAIAFAGFFAQHGFATLAIDNVSHGIVLDQGDAETYGDLAGLMGLKGFFEAMIQGRAIDLDGDGRADSGEDYYTAYVFHTRDNVRQVVLDYMQLVRIARTFGQETWDFDLDGDGQPEVAGDFDADGVADVAAGAPICTLGISLGSMVASILASTEPALDCAASALQGGIMADGGMRSHHDGVPQANALRIMGPLYTGGLEAGTNTLLIQAHVPVGNDDTRRDIARVDGVQPGDTLVAENLATGERGCGLVSGEGGVRAAVASDKGDPHRLTLYEGDALVLGTGDCEVAADAVARATVERFGVGFPIPTSPADGYHVVLEQATFTHGDPLVALADGLALRRANPELRRMTSLAQLVLDRADPAVYAAHAQRQPLHYPGTDEETGASVLLLSMMGDMSVPLNGAAAVARSLGVLDYLEDDPRYGKPANQVLIDTWAMEGVHKVGRYPYGDDAYTGDEYPEGVHMDVENFAQGDDLWGPHIPRLDPPLRLAGPDNQGGMSGIFFGFPRPYGEHGFPLPFELQTKLRAQCAEACAEADGCGCDTLTTFEPSFFYLNLMGHFLGTGGRDIDTDLCLSRNDCRCDPAVDGEHCLGWPEPPPARPLTDFNR